MTSKRSSGIYSALEVPQNWQNGVQQCSLRCCLFVLTGLWLGRAGLFPPAFSLSAACFGICGGFSTTPRQSAGFILYSPVTKARALCLT
jgi:hypothetical protein